jgi:hypothetical protein
LCQFGHFAGLHESDYFIVANCFVCLILMQFIQKKAKMNGELGRKQLPKATAKHGWRLFGNQKGLPL